VTNLSIIFSDLELGNKSDNTFRRVVTASLHPGSVNTNIFPGIRLLSPFLRSSDDVSKFTFVTSHFLCLHTHLGGVCAPTCRTG